MKKKPHIHLINPFWDPAGGNERKALTLYHQLLETNRCDVTLWSEYEPDKRLKDIFPIKSLRTKQLRFPKTGTFVFFGVYYHIGRWIHFTYPNRIILQYNTFTPDHLAEKLKRLTNKKKIEMVYCSELIKQSANMPGVVEPSPIDMENFKPTTHNSAASTLDTFTIGRHSRDTLSKHHLENISLYEELAKEGYLIKLMGGTCLNNKITHKNIALLPVESQPVANFLQGLDCFLYRTSPGFTEAHGRVVTEAMACGIPVVCENRGGYTSLINHGKNGFIFNN
ncbi:MAG: glycosyltransferase, partial [Methylomarinum sp.]|nr:glycosyltransferase [Methylomarinum sp.]